LCSDTPIFLKFNAEKLLEKVKLNNEKKPTKNENLKSLQNNRLKKLIFYFKIKFFPFNNTFILFSGVGFYI
jgi:hypothetical protein